MPRPRVPRIDLSSVIRFAPLAAGPAAAAALGALLMLVERLGWHFPHDFAAAIFGLITVYAAFTAGALGGLIAGGIGWAVLSMLTSMPGQYFAFDAGNKLRLIVMAFALPAVSLLVGWLRVRMLRDNARLREAELLWRLLAEHVPDVVMTLHRDGHIHYLNRELPWTGLSKAETVGRQFVELLPPEYRAPVKKMLPRVLSTGKELRTEMRLTGAGGDIAWFDLRLDPVKRDNEVFAALAVISDMSRRLDEESSHERLVAIVEASTAAIFGTTADGVITSWNPGARRIYGYSPEEIIGKNISALMQEGLAGAEAASLVSRAVGGEHIERFETVHRRKDGSPLDVAVSLSPTGGNKKVTGLAVVVRDLTAQKRTDVERRKTLELLAEAERIAHVGSWEWDLAAGTVTWTDELNRIYGLEPGAAKPSIDAYLRQIVPEDREKVKQAIKKARQEAVPFSFDHRIVRPDGEERVLRAHGAVHRDADSKPARLICTVHDVTAFRRMEAALRMKRDALQGEVRNRTEKLRDTEFRLRTVLDEAPLVLWATDKDGIFTLSEGRGLAAIGIKPGEYVGKSVFETYKNAPTILDNHRRALAGKPVKGTLLFEGRTFDATYLPLRDASGNVTGMTGVAVDMTKH